MRGHQNTLNLNSISYLGPLLHKASQNRTVPIHTQSGAVCLCVYCEVVKPAGSTLIKGRTTRKQAQAQLNKWGAEGFTEERQNPNKL